MEIYRRHSRDCKYLKDGRRATKCACPIWCDGYENGIRNHKSLKTRDWQKAIRELDRRAIEPAKGKTLPDAVKSYLGDCRARGLAESTIYCYEMTLTALSEHMGKLVDLRSITREHITTYRVNRKVSAGSQRKEIAHLKSFFSFCVDHDWIPKNPALKIKPPDAQISPTLPYEKAEVSALLAECDKLDTIVREENARTRARAKALVLLLLYSGFRISDAARLERSKLKPDGRLLIRVMKTGVPLYMKLPKVCLDALAAVPVESQYFFWSGTSDLKAATTSARQTIRTLGKKAGIKAHPHRFRDTFAVELLLNGADIRTVQILLGHSSLKTTESHYAPYTSRMQKVVDDALDLLTYD